ncbi:MAG TPA: hypothetical protein VN108_00415 [Marmoricola sp.]|nr:hypothetical protein [Marmoricola sp.]
MLFVCTGNICRSPLGERLLRVRLNDPNFEVASAGVMAMTGEGMDPEAAAQLEMLGGDSTGFVARQMTEDMLKHSDLILTATRGHRQRTLEERPAGLNRTFTVLEFAELLGVAHGSTPAELISSAARQRSRMALPDVDIPDPYGRGEVVHAEAAQLISDAVDKIAAALAR